MTLGLVLALLTPVAEAQEIHLPAPGTVGQTIALHCAKPRNKTAQAVLFIHGASFPTMLAAGFEFNANDSWMDYMAQHGFLACGLDFLGFGSSSRPAALYAAAESAPPLDRAPEAAAQIAAAVDYLLKQDGVKKVHLVAHSWGTLPAGMYAASHPGTLASLTLFGPIVPIPGSTVEPTTYSWWSVTAQERYQQLQYKTVLPKDLRLLDPGVDSHWAQQFADSVPNSGGDVTAALRIPSGPSADVDDARAGKQFYARNEIHIPVFVVHGDYDNVVNDAAAVQFLEGFTSSPLKWHLQIYHATHVMHLETARFSLYHSVLAFIAAANGLRE